MTTFGSYDRLPEGRGKDDGEMLGGYEFWDITELLTKNVIWFWPSNNGQNDDRLSGSFFLDKNYRSSGV